MGFMNKTYTDLIGESYKNYLTMTEPTFMGKNISLPEYIYWIKTDEKYSEKWGLKIEERELDRLERIYLGVNSGLKLNGIKSNFEHEGLEKLNAPTKLITITYNNETIESYE